MSRQRQLLGQTSYLLAALTVILAALLPLEAALADLPQMQATEQGATRILNGNPGQVLGHADYGTEVWVSRQGRPLCIGRYLGGEVQPVRVFNLG